MCGAPDALEPELDNETGEREEDVEEECCACVGGAEDEKAKKDEEEIDPYGDGMRAVEDGGIAHCELFGCFLLIVNLTPHQDTD